MHVGGKLDDPRSELELAHKGVVSDRLQLQVLFTIGSLGGYGVLARKCADDEEASMDGGNFVCVVDVIAVV